MNRYFLFKDLFMYIQYVLFYSWWPFEEWKVSGLDIDKVKS